MGKRFAGDTILILFLLFFSWWLMTKSFGYDASASQFRIARHEVGDFGLHISLIRSFAWGENIPAQSPFFSGKPIVYHYWVDWFSGQLVRGGIRIDYALNGISAVALTILLYGLYRLAGILAIVLFLLPSNLSFVEIFNRAPKDFSFFSYLWRFPDYFHQGPFDGSLITIYTTLSPYLNQRHLIAGMTIGITMMWVIFGWLRRKKPISNAVWVMMGIILGAATRVHVVLAGATGIMVVVLLLGKRNKALLFFLGAAFLMTAPHLMQIISVRSGLSQLWNPGYLAPRPLTVASWLSFWAKNLGVLIILMPLAYRLTNSLGRRVMVGSAVLFLIANTLQVSYRIEHNHSLINYATTHTLPFVAYLLVTWWRRRTIRWKITAACALILATASGVFNLMVVKNDYQVMIDDVPKNGFMRWVQTETAPSSIFISKHALYDPVTLAGRKNYLGLEYYVTVMGYDYWGRRKQIDNWLSNVTQDTISEMKKQNINYIVIPKDRRDFPYAVGEREVKALLRTAYQDEPVNVYEL